jgi:hypothetical protein
LFNREGSTSSPSPSPPSSSAENVHNKNINNNINVFSDLLSNNNSSSSNNNQPINAKQIFLGNCNLSYFGELDISSSTSIINRDYIYN